MDRKITEYKIVIEKSPADLTKTINEMIKEGWIPTGGIFMTQSPPHKEGDFIVVETRSHQAMVKLQD
ncbi:MAG: DUF1737 domain-containing protein [Bacteroidetes bacterium]|nr:DUF1737 domain-containing protein [Bacteroidota bacterium]